LKWQDYKCDVCTAFGNWNGKIINMMYVLFGSRVMFGKSCRKSSRRPLFFAPKMTLRCLIVFSWDRTNRNCWKFVQLCQHMTVMDVCEWWDTFCQRCDVWPGISVYFVFGLDMHTFTVLANSDGVSKLWCCKQVCKKFSKAQTFPVFLCYCVKSTSYE
jgi:hypothetical protein